VQIGGLNVYTLRKRPVIFSGTTYLFEFEENAGSATNVPFSIYEPSIARQFLPYMWGPDVSGTVFAVGDPLRPGTLYFAKSNAPDSAPDSYNVEITSPSEPLLGGEVVDGLGFVASTERWWALYPQPDNPLQRYNFVQQPITRGLAAPFGHCTDGKEIFFWAKDGILGTSRGSLTDLDLFPLFPHDGIEGQNYTYNGTTYFAPDYSKAPKFRLTHANGYLYAFYIGIDGNPHTLLCDLRRMAWSVDSYTDSVVGAYHVEQPKESNNLLNPVLLLFGLQRAGLINHGVVWKQTDLTNDDGNPISCVVATREFDGGDIRAGEQWGDVYVDLTPAAAGGLVGGVVAQPLSLGVPVAAPSTIPISATRVFPPVSLGGEILANFLGIQLSWIDDYAHPSTPQNSPTSLNIWQPSFIQKPETILDRFSDWDDAGMDGAKWIQGFILHADTFAQAKGMAVRDADALATHPFTPGVNHNGESEIAYSFNQPFIAHMVRLEPASDAIPWRLWQVRWVAEPTPEFAETWTTQPSTHGLTGFMHLRQASITYSATQPVTLTIGVFDGTAPAPITLPSTGGVVKKIVVTPTFNKAQLYTYSFNSSAPFQVYQDKSEVQIGQWGRTEGYVNRPLVGSQGGDEAKV
jgi:hypothetical protein